MSDIHDAAELAEKWFAEERYISIPKSDEISRRQYDEKLVAWFDVLGMRKKIKSSEDAEDVLIIMEKLQNYVSNLCKTLEEEKKLKFLQLSDGFIIVTDKNCIDELCTILCQIQWKVLVDSKMLLRGALTAGLVTMSDDSKLILGPAFIDAFELESETAIFPRILLANEINNFISQRDITFAYIKKDSDNFYYLDFLKYSIDHQENGNYKMIDSILKNRGIKKLIKDNYKEHIVAYKRTAQKWGWLLTKLSEYGIKIL